MEKPKEEIFAELYGLRAGLSVISQNADKIHELETQRAQALSDITTCEREIAALTVDVTKEEEYLQSRQVNFKRYSKIEYSPIIGDVAVGLIIGAIFFLWIIISACVTASLDNGIKGFAIVFAIGYGVSMIIFVTVVLTVNKIGKNKWLTQHEIALSKLKAELDQLSNELILKKSGQENANIEFTQHNNKKIAELKSLIADTEQQIANISLESKPVYNALVAQYSPLILEADWQNIDLIVFYWQTGRSESMKEALQLVDRQRQTEAIVNEIRTANANICSEISHGLRSLGTAVVKCFDILSNQIALQHQETISALSDISQNQQVSARALTESIEQMNKEIVSSVQLNNALQAKANVTSEQLAQDLRFLEYKMGIRN